MNNRKYIAAVFMAAILGVITGIGCSEKSSNPPATTNSVSGTLPETNTDMIIHNPVTPMPTNNVPTNVPPPPP